MTGALPKRPALFLDRDGVINSDGGYVYKIEDCHFIDGAFALARRFADAGYAIVIVTNQSGIGRGYYTENEFRILMDWMRGQFADRGIEIAGVYHSADLPDPASDQHKDTRRKPGAGMFRHAAADLDLDLRNSCCVGDKLTDVQAGRAAGIENLVLFSEGAPTSGAHEDYRIVRALGEIEPRRLTG